LTCFLRQASLADNLARILDQLGWDFLRSLLDILVGFRNKGLTDIFNRVQLPSNEENFELTKLLFTFFTNVSNNEGIVGMLSEDGFLETCLGFLEPLPPHHFPEQYLREENQDGSKWIRDRRGVRSWSPLLMEDLQLHVLDCLAELAPRLWSTAVAKSLLTQLLLLLNWCISDGM
uniref:MMS19 nucleotide excision repair protein n=1 Tax=Schistocephalus solidus TaxID=70667 RepID=A0A183TR11_SCHSO